MTPTLRPYQADLKAAIYAEWHRVRNVLAVAPTGTGKTTVFASVLADTRGPSVAIAHRQELVSQISLALAKNEVRHRIIAPDKVRGTIEALHMVELGRRWVDQQAQCGVAGVDTLLRMTGAHFDAWRNGVQRWVTDECFPAGTLVEGQPIETIQVGQVVTAFNEQTEAFERHPVVRLFRNPEPGHMVRIAAGHHVLECTKGHPFFTRRGWIDAADLTLDDEVKTYAGPEERGVSIWTRVDRVEIFESGNPLEPRVSRGDGHVYNFEVAGLHTYIAGGVVVHNCHHVLRDNKWGRACALFPNAYGLAVTATPIRADGLGLGRHADGIIDSMVLGPTMRESIDAGYLTGYRIFAPKSDLDLSAVKVGESGDYVAAQLRAAVHKSHITGDVVEHYLRLAPGKLGVTFAVDIEEATKIAAAFRARGVPAEVVSSKTPDSQRVAILRRFRRRELLQLVNVDLFGEGFDLPAIEVVSMARPTQSYALYVQQFGRALRPLEGKTDAIVIDHVKNVYAHGLPDARREWSLDRREKRARGANDAMPTTVCSRTEPEVCAQTYERFHPCCPFCGFAPEPVGRSAPEQVDGDLQELDAAMLAAMRGEADRVMGAPRIPAGVPAQAVRHNHMERLRAQVALRDVMQMWGGWREALGESLSQAQRRFYLTFGVDVMTAQALGAREAGELMARLDAAMSGRVVKTDSQQWMDA